MNSHYLAVTNQPQPMKKLLKVLLYLLALVVIAISGVLTYLKVAFPKVDAAENITIEYTTERIRHGEYLANHVCVCMDCHSTRDFTKFSGPLVEGTLGKGGDRFDQTLGLPGVFLAKNITPAGISRYSDGELFRLITTGVTKEGSPMFPLMPYPYYGKMDREDVYDIIAYIRSTPSIANDVPESKADFPMNFILGTIPQNASLTTKPAKSDMLAYGAYMTNASGCIECHTQVDKGQIITGLAFGGGREFKFPDGSVVRSSNITPHAEHGIGTWTEEIFVKRFKAYADSSYVVPSVNKGEFNTIMPWTMYAGMNEEDLKAIFAYLKTIKPQDITVEKFTPSVR